MVETESDRLELLADFGEPFSTGAVTPLLGIFDAESVESVVGDHIVEQRTPTLLCRESDVVLHQLSKGSVVTRLGTNAVYSVRRVEPDGTGMATVVFGK